MMKIRDDWKKKWTFDSLKSFPGNIGFNGCIKDTGFRMDGSYYYGDVYRHPEYQDNTFADTINRIQNGNSRFEWCDHVDPNTLEQLDTLLSYCKEYDIHIIGFLPPFAPLVYRAMEDSSNYGYLYEIEPSCRKLFEQYGFDLFDYMNPKQLPVTDDYFVDGFHGSDIVYGQIIKDIVKNSNVLSKYVELPVLDKLLENAYSELTFFDPDTE